ncbi:MAG: beta-aspartyl-dipeptidase (metallo-type) [Patiriisocius sp.]
MQTLLKNVEVYAPESIGLHNILVGGGSILTLQRHEITTDADVIDCEGRRILPGFIDAHTHITGGGGESGFSTRVPAPFLSQFTAAGVTSVVGVLGTDDTTRDTRSLVAQAYALREHGLGAWCHTGGYHVPATTLTGSIRDDIVFLDPVIGVGELAISDHRSSQPSFEEILRIAADAHVAGLITGKAGIVHLHLGDGKRGLELIQRALNESEIPSRVFNPTHVNRRKGLFEEAVLLASRGCSIDITAFPVAEDEDAWSADAALLRYLDTGAPANKVTVSSDGGGCLPEFNADGVMTKMGVGRSAALMATLKNLLEQDVPLEMILPAVTSNVAELLRFHDRGRIKEGYRADLVLLDEKHNIEGVMVAGVWHVRDGAQIITGAFEKGTS